MPDPRKPVSVSLPRPSSVFFVPAQTCGEDAFLYRNHLLVSGGRWVHFKAVADGVGGWRNKSEANSALYAATLLDQLAAIVEAREDPSDAWYLGENVDAREMLAASYSSMPVNLIGSTTGK